ncbi:Retron-type RNA-directed DNA polymerase [hydrothermal vent metagenome]|uniref:Retron-type RNA-directed DNA polymerase n=1 Tax=hydrothermal vent metagenome TaxID=652676 RepID=A0A3B0YE61_9ZZZZ
MTESSPGQLTRQQLYDRIKESSKDEFILSEMKRLGFWPEEDSPSVTAEVITRTGELERELRALLAKQRRMQNPDLALKDMHKERKAKALERREETRQNNFEAKYQRALNWYQKNQKEIVFLGEGVSSDLNDKQSDVARLAKFGLQSFDNAQALAATIGISLAELKFLTYTRASSKVHHYVQFELPKKTGGTRKISSPMPRLKLVQYWIKNNILAKIPSHSAVHGFMTNKSIVTNAKPHVDSALVINMDLQDFFPSISYQRVKGYFRKIGYSGEIATLLGLLCTESEVDEIELDGDTYYVSKGIRRLPQGAPTSPDISNLICFRLDKRMAGTMTDIGFSYTRYADDMTFSCKVADDNALKKLFWRVHQIIDNEGFVVHPDKTRIMRKGSRQEVTGIIVNDKVSINRKLLRNFKACLHQTLLDGPDGKQWGNGNNLIASLYGFANYVSMVDKVKGVKFMAQVKQIQEKYGQQALPSRPEGKDRLKNIKPENIVNSDEWWQPKLKDAPVRDDRQE